MKLVWILVVIGCSVLGGTAQYLFKAHPMDFSSIKSLLLNYGLISGIVLYGLALLIYLVALKHLPVSVAYPLIALSYVWVAILAFQFLNEKMLWYNWVGAIVIITGIGLMVAR